MLKNAILKQINKHIGQYLYGFSQEQLDVGILKGHIDLKKVNIRPDKINQLLIEKQIPLQLKLGIITNLTVDIPSIFDWKELDAKITDVFFVFGPNLHGLHEMDDHLDQEEYFKKLCSCYEKNRAQIKKKLTIFQMGLFERAIGPIISKFQEDPHFIKVQKNIEKKKDPQSAEELSEEEKDRILFKILKNLKCTIKNIHIRYEDDQLVYKSPVSFGFLIEELFLDMTSLSIFEQFTEQKPRGMDIKKILMYPQLTLPKKVILKNFRFYLNSESELFIPFGLWRETKNTPKGILEAMEFTDLQNLMLMYFKRNRRTPIFNLAEFSLLNINFCFVGASQKLSIKDSTILIQASINNPNIKIKPKSIEEITYFLEYKENFSMWKTLKEYKPLIRPMSLSKQHYWDKKIDTEVKHLIIREWFFFLIWKMRIQSLLLLKNFEYFLEGRRMFQYTSALYCLEHPNFIEFDIRKISILSKRIPIEIPHSATEPKEGPNVSINIILMIPSLAVTLIKNDNSHFMRINTKAVALNAYYLLDKHLGQAEVNIQGFEVLYNTYKDENKTKNIFDPQDDSILRPSIVSDANNRSLSQNTPERSHKSNNYEQGNLSMSKKRNSTKIIKNQIVSYEELHSVQGLTVNQVGRPSKMREASLSKRSIFNEDRTDRTPERLRNSSNPRSLNSPLLPNRSPILAQTPEIESFNIDSNNQSFHGYMSIRNNPSDWDMSNIQGNLSITTINFPNTETTLKKQPVSILEIRTPLCLTLFSQKNVEPKENLKKTNMNVKVKLGEIYGNIKTEAFKNLFEFISSIKNISLVRQGNSRKEMKTLMRRFINERKNERAETEINQMMKLNTEASRIKMSIQSFGPGQPLTNSKASAEKAMNINYILSKTERLVQITEKDQETILINEEIALGASSKYQEELCNVKNEDDMKVPTKKLVVNVGKPPPLIITPPLGKSFQDLPKNENLDSPTFKLSLGVSEIIDSSPLKTGASPNFLSVPGEKAQFSMVERSELAQSIEIPIPINIIPNAQKSADTVSFKASVKESLIGNSINSSEWGAQQMKQSKFSEVQRKKAIKRKKQRREDGLLESMIFISDNFDIFLCIEIEKVSIKIFDNLAAASGHIVEVSMPPGEIKLSLNNPFSSSNFVEVYGIKIETPDKLKAVYFFVQKLRALVNLYFPSEEFQALLSGK